MKLICFRVLNFVELGLLIAVEIYTNYNYCWSFLFSFKRLLAMFYDLRLMHLGNVIDSTSSDCSACGISEKKEKDISICLSM